MPTALAGAYVVEQERHADERGFFARTWCAREFADGANYTRVAQRVDATAKQGLRRLFCLSNVQNNPFA